jgi:hypothetical protein
VARLSRRAISLDGIAPCPREAFCPFRGTGRPSPPQREERGPRHDGGGQDYPSELSQLRRRGGYAGNREGVALSAFGRPARLLDRPCYWLGGLRVVRGVRIQDPERGRPGWRRQYRQTGHHGPPQYHSKHYDEKCVHDHRLSHATGTDIILTIRTASYATPGMPRTR